MGPWVMDPSYGRSDSDSEEEVKHGNPSESLCVSLSTHCVVSWSDRAWYRTHRLWSYYALLNALRKSRGRSESFQRLITLCKRDVDHRDVGIANVLGTLFDSAGNPRVFYVRNAEPEQAG